MKFYLSSYKLGNQTEELVNFLKENKKIGYIPNALDCFSDVQRRKEMEARQLNELKSLGLDPELLDLREYFENKQGLEKKLNELGGVWVNGGNTFVLRQAMKLSGFDDLLLEKISSDFTYAGFSAAGCVLAPTLDVLQIVDEPTIAYEEIKEIVWVGLGIVGVAFMPHYDSNHSESEDIAKEIALCEEKNIPYKTLRDGEVWVFEKNKLT